MVLYRKYRPQKFAEVIGQEHIKKVLINSLKADKIGQAYLFSGSRGTGKTTMARLLAKALNCRGRKPEVGSRKSEIRPPISEPCDECQSCREIMSDSSLDVMEIDAASNRGIDEIRELREKIKYLPTSNRYKVFIIDEVHMLTKEAFNALLKTLEEPPRHAIFIMATTELYKVPDTILSRSQQFDFKRASKSEIIQGLKRISKAEQLKLTDQARELIAQAADGSQRDALTILEQVSSISEDEITEESVRDILGLVPYETINNFISYLLNNNPQAAIDLIDQVYLGGYDLGQFNQSIIENLRQKMVAEQNYQLFNYINKFVAAGKDLKLTKLPQLPLELAVIEISNQLSVTSNQLTKEPKNVKTERQEDLEISKSKDIKSKDIKKEKKDEVPPTINHKSKINNLQSKWPEIVGQVANKNHSLSLLIKDAVPLGIKDNKLQIAVKFKFYAERISAPEKYTLVSEAIEKILGRKLGVECLVENNSKNDETVNDDLINNALEIFG